MLSAIHIETALRAAGAGGGLVMPSDEIAAAFNDAILTYGNSQFDTVNKVAALVSECMQESAYFRTTEEYAKDGRYAPYIGRTFIQLTWQTNYAAFGAWCFNKGLVADPDVFVKAPKLLADRKWAALGGVWYFTRVLFHGKPLTAYSDDIGQVGKAVNLGDPFSKYTPNGHKARAAAYEAVRALGPTIIPKPSEPVEELPMAANVAFRGMRTCSCVATALPWIELDMLLRGQIKSNIDIFQLNGNAPASAGTHAPSGCMDVGQWNTAQIDTWRRWGSTMQRRDLKGVVTHGHGWMYGCPHLPPEARDQARDWDRGDSGLAGSAGIAGRYPIKNWQTAYRENKMALLDDVKKAAREGAEEAIRKGIDVKAVWGTDALPAPAYALEADPKNKNWMAQSFLKVIAEEVRKLRGSMDNRAAEAKRIEAAIKAITPAPTAPAVKP